MTEYQAEELLLQIGYMLHKLTTLQAFFYAFGVLLAGLIFFYIINKVLHLILSGGY